MSNDHRIVRTDLTILEEIVIEVEPYLMSESIRWLMAKQERSELAIGKPFHIKAGASYVM